MIAMAHATPVTMWVIGDLDAPDGRQTMINALEHLQHEHAITRLGFVHVPSTASLPSAGLRLSTILYQLLSASVMQNLPPSDLLGLVTEKIAQDADVVNLAQDGRIFAQSDQKVFEGGPLHALTSSGWSVTDTAAAAEFWRVGAEIAKSLGIKEGQTHLLVNGRVSNLRGSSEFAC